MLRFDNASLVATSISQRARTHSNNSPVFVGNSIASRQLQTVVIPSTSVVSNLFGEMYNDTNGSIFINDEMTFDDSDNHGSGRYPLVWAGFQGNEARTACVSYQYNGTEDQPNYNLFEFGIGGSYSRFAHGRWVKHYLNSGYTTHTWNNSPQTPDQLPAPRSNYTYPVPHDNDWHHTCVTWDGTTMKAYHDGAYAGDYSQDFEALDTGDAFNYWGHYDDRFRFEGRQKKLLLLKGRALTLEEVVTVTAGGFGVTTQTTNPSLAPSSNPSTSPTATAPWDIVFLNLTANFGVNSAEFLTLNYMIGRDRDFNTFLKQKDCSSNITDGIILSSTNSTAYNNATYESLTLTHGLNKTLVSTSNIWNDTSKEIEVCQIIQLLGPEMNGEHLVIIEDKLAIDVSIDLNVDYNLTSGLGAATINNASDTTSVDDYIESYKCDGIDYVRDTSALVPNEDLYICIMPKSPDVLILASVDKMDISQNGRTPFAVINANGIVAPSITDIAYDNGGGVSVRTRVPINLFDFLSGNSITVSGAILTKLVNSGRKLEAVIGATADANEEASFELNVNLKRDMTVDEEVMMKSEASVVITGFVMIGVVFASAMVIW